MKKIRRFRIREKHVVNSLKDLSHTWWMIGIGFFLACVLSFVWILLMRFFTGIMVWTSIGLIFVLVSGLFGYSLHRYYQVKDITTNQINILQVNLTPDYLNNVLQLADTWLAFAIILGILTGIVLLVLIALRNRIQIAVELLEQAAKAVGQLCSSIFWPIFPFVLHVLVSCNFFNWYFTYYYVGRFCFEYDYC